MPCFVHLVLHTIHQKTKMGCVVAKFVNTVTVSKSFFFLCTLVTHGHSSCVVFCIDGLRQTEPSGNIDNYFDQIKRHQAKTTKKQYLLIFGAIQLHCLLPERGKERYLLSFFDNMFGIHQVLNALKLPPLFQDMITDIVYSTKSAVSDAFGARHGLTGTGQFKWWEAEWLGGKPEEGPTDAEAVSVPTKAQCKMDKIAVYEMFKLFSDGKSLVELLEKWKSFIRCECTEYRLKIAMSRFYDKLSDNDRAYYPFHKKYKGKRRGKKSKRKKKRKLCRE
jgi:hypothetical protein